MNILQEKINNKYPNEDICVLEYTIMKESAKVKCNICNTEYTLTKAENFIRKDKKCICRKCINNGSGKRYTLESFQNKINKKYPFEDLTVLNYTLKNEECSIKCNKCGEIYTLKNAESFLKKDKQRVCKDCLPNKIRFLEASKENFKEYILKSNNFILRDSLDNIKSSDYLVSCECVFCHKINKKTIYDYMRNKGCVCQGNNIPISSEEVQAELGDSFELLKFEGGARGHMKIRHKNCGFIFKRSRTSEKRRKILCPKCDKAISKGEKIIMDWLDNHNITYINEFPVEIENHKLRFDFYLPGYDRYIEFQGIQHYKVIEYFGGEAQLNLQQQYDELKRKYCKNKLLEISYILSSEEVEKLLSDNLLKFND